MMDKKPKLPAKNFDRNEEERIDTLARNLYDEALDTDSSTKEEVHRICPMYDALRQVKERYLDPELIGEGAMKEVYRVYDAHAGRHVAIACLRPELGEDYYDAFLREAHLTSRLEHNSIIRILNIEIDPKGRPYFTMEFKRGQSLRQLLRNLKKGKESESYPLSRRLFLFRRICEAIAYAHSRQVLHLDLKPENIQVGEFGEVQVCDWGLGVLMRHAQNASEKDTLLDPDLYGSLQDSVRGTPGYMAPESKDKLQAKTPSMDIYALGCILEELLTLNEVEKIDHNNLQKQFDRSLASVITQAKAPQPSGRYLNVKALGNDIERYLAGFSTQAEPQNFLYELTLFYRRNSYPCLIALGIIVLITLITAVFTNQLNKKKNEAEEALALYLHEQKVSSRRIETHAESTIADMLRMTHPGLLAGPYAAQVMENLKNQVRDVEASTPPRNSRIWYHKIWMAFITQDFQEAIKVPKPEYRNVDDLRALLPKYAKLKQDRDFLEYHDLIELLKELRSSPRGRRVLTEQIINYDYTVYGHQRTDEAYITIVKNLLQFFNPNMETFDLRLDVSTRELVLRGSQLRYLLFRRKIEPRSGLSVLRFLQPQSLDLRETGVYDLNELKGLNLFSLDIRQTPVKDLTPLQDMLTLRRLVVSPEQFSPEVLRQVPDFIEAEKK
ncbi:MAG: serine/threonine-protein kinase [Verrucomicrobiota bacterium]